MCYKCEMSDGKYKNQLGVSRCVLCFIGLFFVICLGVGAGLLAHFYKDIEAEQYWRLSNLVGDGRMVKNSEKDCPNYEAINKRYNNPDYVYVWKCEDSSECIKAENRCDGYYHCKDKSDENNCNEFCDAAVRRGLRWKCTNPQNATHGLGPAQPVCFLPAFRCDGFEDCPNDALNDESECSPDVQFLHTADDKKQLITCSNGNTVICYDYGFCTRPENLCDGFNDCIDNTDEIGC